MNVSGDDINNDRMISVPGINQKIRTFSEREKDKAESIDIDKLK